MKLKTPLFALLLTLISLNASANNSPDKENVFEPVIKLFEAMSKVDHSNMKAAVTEDFVLLEHGEVWSIDDLANAVKPSEYKRTNYFSEINSHRKGDIAWINYWNKANFSNGVNSENVVWLESVVAIKRDGHWRLSQMHSTKLEPKNFPKGIDYKPAAK